MIKFIFGKYGSGKTTEILRMIKEDAEKGVASVLIVPEQEAVQTERLTLTKLPNNAQLTLEVLNFSRLYNRVCRDYGGLCYSYATKPIKHLLMWQTLRLVFQNLKQYSKNAIEDPAFVSTMISTVSEMKAASITPEELEVAAAECADSHLSLSDRLYDISTIYATYCHLLDNSYNDSADDLAKLCRILDEYPFFKDKNVYIDSFTSFTGVEHKIIDKIFASAKNVIVSIPLNDGTYTDISTKSTEGSLKLLKKSANKWGGYEAIDLGEDKRMVHPSLSYLSKNIWNISPKKDAVPKYQDHIITEVCDNTYSEAEAMASYILKLLSEGARCKDIVIIPRDSSKYKGIIDFAFENAGIPYYFSEKTDLCSLPPVKFILTALKIHRYNWQRKDVISHIKTGLCNVTLRDADIFEEYVNTWNISGKRFTADEWTMNPDGFEIRISDRGKNILKTANEVRKKICEPLERFFINLNASDSIADMCRALYRYMEESELRKKTLELAKKELSYGNKKTASELTSLYDIILSTLADIGEVSGDMPPSAEDFYTILKIVFDQTEVGTIPTSIDEVIIGSASMLRSSSPKYVFIPGLCEGEYPMNVDDTGLLCSTDREILEKYDIILGNTEDIRVSDELMYIKNAFSTPTEKLFLLTPCTTPKGDQRSPSLPFRRVISMFDITPHKFNGNDLSFLCGSPTSAATHLRSISNAADRLAATDAVAEHLPLVAEISSASTTPEDKSIDPIIVKRILGDKLIISPSSLEKYAKCPFNYFAHYWLSLREVKYGRFGSNHFGSFVHYIMENIVKFIIPNTKDLVIPTDEEIRAEIKRIVSEYIQLLIKDPSYNTKRMEYLYNKLERLSLLIIDNTINEFRDSDFRPLFFEYSIGKSTEDASPLSVLLSNGASLLLTGYIDRVDIWKDNEKVYVRIVDYKSGKKQFSLDDVSNGINIQMLLYLFALCRDPGNAFRLSTGINADNAPVPAGVVYLSSYMTKQTLGDFSTSEDDILETAKNSISRSGIILDEESVITAMSHSHSKNILLGVEQKNGAFVGKALLSSDDFKDLYSQIYETITEIGERIYGGRADTQPMYPIKTDPCAYCQYTQLCRKNDFGRRK